MIREMHEANLYLTTQYAQFRYLAFEVFKAIMCTSCGTGALDFVKSPVTQNLTAKANNSSTAHIYINFLATRRSSYLHFTYLKRYESIDKTSTFSIENKFDSQSIAVGIHRIGQNIPQSYVACRYTHPYRPPTLC